MHLRRPAAEREAEGAGDRWAEGRERSKERRRWIAFLHTSGSLWRRGGGTVSYGEAASGRRCGNLGFCWDGE
jgi:hypothetical protein